MDKSNFIKKCLLVFLWLNSITAFGQHRHELKIDALGFAFSDIQISYEYFLSEKRSLEFDLRFWNESDSEDTLNLMIFERYIPYKENAISLSVGYKMYVHTKNNSGLSAGVYTSYLLYTHIDDWFVNYRRRNTNENFDINDWDRWDIGINGSYKFVIAKQLIIEPAFSFGADLLSLINEKTMDAIPNFYIKAGYRF